MPALRIEALPPRHQLEGFDCGNPGLNRFLLLHALTNQRANISRTLRWGRCRQNRRRSG